jgi:hypothetical protein
VTGPSDMARMVGQRGKQSQENGSERRHLVGLTEDSPFH